MDKKEIMKAQKTFLTKNIMNELGEYIAACVGIIIFTLGVIKLIEMMIN